MLFEEQINKINQEIKQQFRQLVNLDVPPQPTQRQQAKLDKQNKLSARQQAFVNILERIHTLTAQKYVLNHPGKDVCDKDADNILIYYIYEGLIFLSENLHISLSIILQKLEDFHLTLSQASQVMAVGNRITSFIIAFNFIKQLKDGSKNEFHPETGFLERLQEKNDNSSFEWLIIQLRDKDNKCSYPHVIAFLSIVKHGLPANDWRVHQINNFIEIANRHQIEELNKLIEQVEQNQNEENLLPLNQDDNIILVEIEAEEKAIPKEKIVNELMQLAGEALSNDIGLGSVSQKVIELAIRADFIDNREVLVDDYITHHPRFKDTKKQLLDYIADPHEETLGLLRNAVLIPQIMGHIDQFISQGDAQQELDNLNHVFAQITALYEQIYHRETRSFDPTNIEVINKKRHYLDEFIAERPSLARFKDTLIDFIAEPTVDGATNLRPLRDVAFIHSIIDHTDQFLGLQGSVDPDHVQTFCAKVQALHDQISDKENIDNYLNQIIAEKPYLAAIKTELKTFIEAPTPDNTRSLRQKLTTELNATWKNLGDLKDGIIEYRNDFVGKIKTKLRDKKVEKLNELEKIVSTDPDYEKKNYISRLGASKDKMARFETDYKAAIPLFKKLDDGAFKKFAKIVYSALLVLPVAPVALFKGVDKATQKLSNLWGTFFTETVAPKIKNTIQAARSPQLG